MKTSLMFLNVAYERDMCRFSVLNINSRKWEGSLFGLFFCPGVLALDILFLSVSVYAIDGKIKVRVM